MIKKRERLEVIHDILKMVQKNHNSIKPTPLLRSSNLSSQSFSEYIKELKNKKFVKVILNSKNKRYITLTDKGFRYLEKYQTITNLIEEFGL